MGKISETSSVVLRLWEVICAAISTGIVGTYLHYLDDAHVGFPSRITYTVAVGSLSIFFALVLVVPTKYSFWAFPLDFILFVMWMVAFGLLVDLAGTNACNSVWYWNTWGWYWGGFYHYNSVPSRAIVGTTGCAQWRANLAFAFMGGWTWFVSMCLGIYVTIKRRSKRDSLTDPIGPVTYKREDALPSPPATGEIKSPDHGTTPTIITPDRSV